jgi:hypothetical protein
LSARRALAVLLALAAAAVGLIACGGGSGSGGSTTVDTGSAPAAEAPAAAEPAGDPAEAAWSKEVRRLMSEFENKVSSKIVPTIQDSYSQRLLEPLYRNYGAAQERLAEALRRSKAPAACKAAHDKIAADGDRLAALTQSLGAHSDLNERQYSVLLGREGEKVRSVSLELTKLTAHPTC